MVATQIAVQRGTNEKIDRSLEEIRECKFNISKHSKLIERLQVNIKFIGWVVVALTTVITGVKIVGSFL